MFRTILLLTAIFTFAIGCTNKYPVHDEQTDEIQNEWVDASPKFQTENYLIAHEKLIESLVPKERQAAIRILDWMIDFMAEGRCKPEEILLNVVNVERSHWVLEERTDVRLRVPGYPMGFGANLYTIRENHVISIELKAEEYLCTSGCCSNRHFPKEYYAEFWEDIGKFSRLQDLDIGVEHDFFERR